jgi:hypothetical protein
MESGLRFHRETTFAIEETPQSIFVEGATIISAIPSQGMDTLALSFTGSQCQSLALSLVAVHRDESCPEKASAFTGLESGYVQPICFITSRSHTRTVRADVTAASMNSVGLNSKLEI